VLLGEGGDQPLAFFGVRPGWRRGWPVKVVEHDVRVRLNVVGSGQREERLRLQQVLPPVDPQRVYDVEGVGEGEVVQP
jgi:hypothetical protein